MTKVYVIGIGYRPLDARAHEFVLNAGTILASNRLYEIFTRYEEFSSVKERIKVINKVDQTMDFLHSSLGTLHASPPVVLLASGDPLFSGIGRRVLAEFGPDCVEVLPDLSSIQLAFARVKEPWDNAFLMSLHGGPDPEKRRRLPHTLVDVPELLATHGKIGILTDRENGPLAIANILRRTAENPAPEIRMFVCERLGYDDERITGGTPSEIAANSFAEPNVVILMRSQESGPGRNGPGDEAVPFTLPPGPVFGLTEDEIIHSRGLITKDEVRAVALHKLRLPQQGVFWDIGAGSGSVSLEAAGMHPGLKVFMIERNREQLTHIRANISAFGLHRISVITGEAPEVLKDLPPPDRVFIGGSGGRFPEIMDRIMEKMKAGIIVLNAISLETLNGALQVMSGSGLDPEVVQISVARSKVVNGQRHLSALNPIFVVKGEKR